MFCFGDTLDEAEKQIDGVMGELSTGEALALSILKDMARMAKRNAMGGAHA